MNTLKSILTTIFFLGGITFAQEETKQVVMYRFTLGDTLLLLNIQVSYMVKWKLTSFMEHT